MGFNFHVGLPGPFSYTARLTGRRRYHGGRSGFKTLAETVPDTPKTRRVSSIILLTLCSVLAWLSLPLMILSVTVGVTFLIMALCGIGLSLFHLRRTKHV